MKKFRLVALLVWIFALPCLAQTPETKPDNSESYLPTVPRGHWAYNAINKAVEFKILDPSKALGKDQILTRFEFAILTAQALSEVSAMLKKSPSNEAPLHYSCLEPIPEDYVPVHRPEITDLTRLLVTEFYGELLRLGVPAAERQPFLETAHHKAGKPDPIVAELRKGLMALFKTKNLQAAGWFSEDAFVTEYQAQDFLVHEIS